MEAANHLRHAPVQKNVLDLLVYDSSDFLNPLSKCCLRKEEAKFVAKLQNVGIIVFTYYKGKSIQCDPRAGIYFLLKSVCLTQVPSFCACFLTF